MSSKRGILVTGGCGFIGRKLCLRLRKMGLRVRILDNLAPQVHGTSPDLSWISDASVEFIQGSVCQPEICHRAVHEMQVIVHLASETGTGQSMYEIRRYMDVNVTGTATIIEAAIQAGIEQLVLTSSRAVYGEGTWGCVKCGPVHAPARRYSHATPDNWNPICPKCGEHLSELLPTAETESLEPTSIYGLSKLAQEQMARVVENSSSLRCSILRLFNVYGPGQALNNPYTGVLGVFINRARLGETLDLYEDGNILRDFVHVEDVNDAVVRALDKQQSVIANIGSGTTVSISELAQAIITACSSRSGTRITGKTRRGDVRGGLADIHIARQLLNWQPKINFEDGLKDYVAWALEQTFEDRYELSLEELRKAGIYA
jgi:dTDP-L-rhamnose 4-epimerase